MVADNENTGVADIQENFEDIETDYDHDMAEELICMTDAAWMPDVFKKGNDYVVGSLVLAHRAL